MNSVYDCCLLWVLLTSDSAEIVYMMDSVRLLFLPFQFAFFFPSNSTIFKIETMLLEYIYLFKNFRLCINLHFSSIALEKEKDYTWNC